MKRGTMAVEHENKWKNPSVESTYKGNENPTSGRKRLTHLVRDAPFG